MYVYTCAGTQLVKPLSLEEYSQTPPLMRAGRHPTRDRLRGEPGLAKKGDQKMGLLELCCFEKRVVIHIDIYIYVCVNMYVCAYVRRYVCMHVHTYIHTYTYNYAGVELFLVPT